MTDMPCLTSEQVINNENRPDLFWVKTSNHKDLWLDTGLSYPAYFVWTPTKEGYILKHPIDDFKYHIPTTNMREAFEYVLLYRHIIIAQYKRGRR